MGPETDAAAPAGRRVKIGVIGGSGLGEALAGQVEGVRHEIDTPFGKPSDAILEVPLGGTSIYLLSRHGPGHTIHPSAIPVRANIFALKKLGVTHIIASGAVGSLREEFKPRDLVIADQVIDKTYKRANTFYEQAAVHVEFAEPFCPRLRRILIETGKELAAGGEAGDRAAGDEAAGDRFGIHDRACYVCMEGPAFSTRAESLMHRLWGGDLIGMTAMPEAKLAREAEIGYALVALVTDYDCWKQVAAAKGPGQAATGEAGHADPAVLLKEIIANLKSASDNGIRLIKAAVSRIAKDETLQQELLSSPACSALQLAIWSDKSRIAPEQVELLSPLWMKYFGPPREG